MPDKSPPPVSILIKVEPPIHTLSGERPSFEIMAEPVLRGGTRSDYRWSHALNDDLICSYSWEWDEDPKTRDFDCLMVRAFSSSLSPEYLYQGRYSDNLRSAERMFRTLRSLDRKRDRLLTKQAAPQTFGQEVAVFAQLIGADAIGYRLEDMTGRPDGGRIYRWIESRSEAAESVDALIDRCGERFAAPVGMDAYYQRSRRPILDAAIES